MSLILVLIAVQIITESLPISSSGHVRLISLLVQCITGTSMDPLPLWLDHLLHGPTLLIVVLYFYNAWMPLLQHLLTIFSFWKSKHYAYNHLRSSHKQLLHIIYRIVKTIIIADGVTACWYLFIKIFCKNASWIDSTGILLVGFTITAGILLSTKWKKTHFNTKDQMLFALLLGCMQGLALLPGISRFATTLTTSLLLGLSPRRAFQCSWLIFSPLMAAAFLLQGLPALFQHITIFTSLDCTWVVVITCATVISYFLLWCAETLTKRTLLWLFGLYMIAPIITLMFIKIKDCCNLYEHFLLLM